MHKAISFLLVAGLIAGTARAEDLVIESFSRNGQLTFNTVSNGASYRVEWAPSLTNAWTNFAAAASALDNILAAGGGSVTTSVPIFYRVVATVETPHDDLVINEINYDDLGPDSNEFIEIYNKEAFAVALSDYKLEFVNGANSAVYLTVQLTNSGPSIPANGYLVVGSTAVVSQVAGAMTISMGNDFMQNGVPDGVRLVVQDGTFVDGIAYEGTMPGVGEGATAPADSPSTNSLQRFPDGADTDNNADDFELAPPTPGASNVLPLP